MENYISLHSLFTTSKEELSNKLQGLSLPKDSQEIQNIVSEFLNNLFESNGNYRQHLTLSEDYILQAAMSLLNAQQSIISELTKIHEDHKPVSSSKDSYEKNRVGIKKEQFPITIGGTAIGGAAGALVLSTWGAVFGAIAGTAIAIYFTAQQNQGNSPSKVKENIPKLPIENKINTESFIEIVENICQSIDTLVGTFRAQVNKVVDKYERAENPSLETDYLDLIENIQGLIGAYEMDANNEIRSKRIEQRIQFLVEGLENYDIQAIKYNGNNKELFNFQSSSNVDRDTMILPAIIKKNKTIIKGKVFTKE